MAEAIVFKRPIMFPQGRLQVLAGPRMCTKYFCSFHLLAFG
ncbi:hypothetical protein HMPREF3198_00744 [Winkia neuii]|nr:hypothetical protein HMPREF3198_00744 [Winkia neuii]